MVNPHYPEVQGFPPSNPQADVDVMIKMLAGARELLATVVNEDKRRWGLVCHA